MSEPLVESGEDPWVILHDDAYYYCRNNPEYSSIFVAKSKTLADIGHVALIEVWNGAFVTEFSKEIWAPELHHLDGKWHIYFAASDGENKNHRMCVLRALTDDPQGPYEYMGKIATEDDHWAIDGTVLEMDDSSRYFIWSGWKGKQNVNQNLYIARMNSPTTLSGPRVCISRPEYKWEIPTVPASLDGAVSCPGVNEGPQVLKRNGKVYIIYSANGSWTNDYCLGQLELVGNDVLNPKSWQKYSEPVFQSTETVKGVGHASFTVKRIGMDALIDTIVYHAARHSNSGWDRQVWSQPFVWIGDKPYFGTPQHNLPSLEVKTTVLV